MLARLSQRIDKSKGQGGFTLIELLVVIIIIGILLAIAIPSYLKFRDRANKSAAQANVRASIPAVEAYYADHATYAGIEAPGALTAIDGGVRVTVIGTPDASTYCISNTQGGFTYYKHGPAGDITTTACTGG